MLILCLQAVCNNEKNNLDISINNNIYAILMNHKFHSLYFGCCLLEMTMFQCPILDTYINTLQRNPL